MAKGFNNMECLKSSMECSICLLVELDNPKVLNCGHQFCKQCLENVIGCDAITCPDCHVQTVISVVDQTINVLSSLTSLTSLTSHMVDKVVPTVAMEQVREVSISILTSSTLRACAPEFNPRPRLNMQPLEGSQNKLSRQTSEQRCGRPLKVGKIDIELVRQQSNVSRKRAVKALRESNNDIVMAIMVSLFLLCFCRHQCVHHCTCVSM